MVAWFPIMVTLIGILGSGFLIFTHPDLMSKATTSASDIQNGMNQPQSSILTTMPHQTSNAIKDFAGTVIGKVDVSGNPLGINSADLETIKESSRDLVPSTFAVFGDVKHITEAILKIIAPRVFGTDLPWFVIPLITAIMIAVFVFGLIRHAKTIIYTVLILGILILSVLSIGSFFK